MYGGLLLRRRVEHVNSVQVPEGECELRGRDVLRHTSRGAEQHLSSGALLSGGLSVAGAMSSGYELVVDRASKCHRLSGVSEGILLS